MKRGLLSIISILFTAASPGLAQGIMERHFDKDKIGALPKDFTTALTGSGREGVWIVVKDDASPGQKNVLAQTDADATSYRFPVCIYERLSARDVDLSVKFKPVSGKKDQAAGLVWRYRDKDNYYVARANALENNVVLYKVQNGKREDLPLKGEGRTYGRKARVPSGQWSTLRVTAKGNLFTVFLNGEKLCEVEDATFAEAGKVGLWTKADSATYFDDLMVSVSGQTQGKQTEQVIIFVCEHGAAKSILSAAIFNKLAGERGLNLRAIARGTNPDPEISPKVARGLQADGLVASELAPKKISRADLSGARRVVTFCALPDDYPDYRGGIQVENWDDVLPAIEDYGEARDRLTERIKRLLDELN
jgi:protein-tyrosine-phosphatase